jgi:hypothetical protein
MTSAVKVFLIIEIKAQYKWGKIQKSFLIQRKILEIE